ncbi:MAG: PQQ-binding-like beta-propeller repeat protein, partial [Lachnospiraceae bacterium]|nr:PQQ-binding-like beta-propeller repeat protein [Lachnospiraceae bacterium]
DAHSMGDACIYKLNAMTGEIVWKKPYNVHTVKGYAGGVLSTGALGEGVIGDYIIYSVSKTPGLEAGYLAALNRKDGTEAWRIDLDKYSWSSTVITYTKDGKAYIVQGCQNGDLLLIDALDGSIKNRLDFGSAIEATPVVYNNNIVLATRSERIFGVKLE